MKIALLLSMACAALMLNGCSTAERGGSTDTYDTTTSTMEQPVPTVTDPSLPQNPNAGPQISPP